MVVLSVNRVKCQELLKLRRFTLPVRSVMIFSTQLCTTHYTRQCKQKTAAAGTTGRRRREVSVV